MNKAILIILLFLSGIANAEEKKILIDIDGLKSRLSISETISFRWSPHMYFDQAVSTISKVEKDVVFLCS